MVSPNGVSVPYVIAEVSRSDRKECHRCPSNRERSREADV